jgi:hypothetical protein
LALQEAFASEVHGTTSTGAAGSEVTTGVVLVELFVGTAAAATARSSDVMALGVAEAVAACTGAAAGADLSAVPLFGVVGGRLPSSCRT